MAKHIVSGNAWTLGAFQDNQRVKGKFISSQLVALDFDNGNVSVEKALSHPFIQQYAMLVHPSASSTASYPKTRVVFVLSEPVAERLAWESLQQGLLEHFADWKPDPACKDSARLFYGSTQEGWHVLNNTLPLQELGGLCANIAWTEMQFAKQPPRTVNPESFSGKRYLDIKAAVEASLGISGSEDLDSDGFCVRRFRCPVHNHEHDDTDPAFTYKPEISAGWCHKRSESYNLFELARALGIQVDSWQNKRRMKADPKAVPAPATAKSLEEIIKKSQANADRAAEYFKDMFNVNEYVSRERMVGALVIPKDFNGYKLEIVRYIVPNYFKDVLYGARVRLDLRSARKAWWQFEEDDPTAFKKIRNTIPFDEDDEDQYWSQVYKLFGGTHGFVETDRIYNISACLAATPDGKAMPKEAPHLVIVADNNEADILSLVSAGYCAVGASMEEKADLRWLYSEAHQRLVVARETQRQLAIDVCEKAGLSTFCLLPDSPGMLTRTNRLSAHLSKYDVYSLKG